MESDLVQNHEAFSCIYSNKTDAITVTVHDGNLFEHLKSLLTSSYIFLTNKNNTGIETTIFVDCEKCVVTVYNNKTVFLQGKGCRTWKTNVLDTMLQSGVPASSSATTSPSGSLNHSSFFNQDGVSCSPVDSSNTLPRSRFSPLSLLHRLVNSRRSPSKQTPLKSKHSSEISSKSLQLLTKSPSVESMASNPTCSPLSSSSMLDTSETEVKQVVNENLTMTEMQKSIQQLKTQLNIQVEKTGKLESELEKMKQNLKAQTAQNSALVSEVKQLKKELSQSTSRCLCLEEDKTKMKQTIDRLSNEKSNLVTELIKLSKNSDTIETQLQTITTCTEMKVEAEMKNLKQTILSELSEIKSSMTRLTNTKPSLLQTAVSNPSSSARKEPEVAHVEFSSQPSSSINRNKQAPRTVDSPLSTNTTCTINPSSVKVYIAGDSITKKLSPSIMSDSKTSVKIRSHPGAKVDTINKNLKELRSEEKQLLKSSDIFVLHVGTNDVSNGESPKSIVSSVKNVANSVKSINPKIKIVYSSILPKKSEKVVNQIISSVNKEIKSMCDRFGYIFLNNDPIMMKDGQLNHNLFYDHVHLNSSGGKLFGSNLKKCINSVSGIQSTGASDPDVVVIDTPSTSSDRGFHNGRPSGRRNYSPRKQAPTRYQYGRSHPQRNQSNWYDPSQMMFYPPWMMDSRY